MTKISIDMDNIVKCLESIGYEVSDQIRRENNGVNWQIKFFNSGATVTIYDTNRKNNSVVNGKPEHGEQESLKEIIDKLKCKELEIDPINPIIVDLINQQKEDYYVDYKREFHKDKADLLHDILCLSNNTQNKEAYLIYGVNDKCEVVGVESELRSNEIFDFLKTQKFAGSHIPEIEVKNLFYKYKKIAVIICKSSKHVPFYLSEKYKGVFAHQIYTRVGDTNTPKTNQAIYSDVEKLWEIHFKRKDE